jgi:cyclopropane-fatty-acyl-phospholipid synthase
LASLRGIRSGRLQVIDHDGEYVFGDQETDLVATIKVLDSNFYRRAAIGGSIAVGESYMDGCWICEDLVSLIRVFAKNLSASSAIGRIGNAFVSIARKHSHRLNRNTRSGSRRNIAAHYDLSNEFYSLFLDETMTYSSGIFSTPETSMADASIQKYDRLCSLLQLEQGDRLVEIGTGWGGFAIHAAKHFGCHVTTTTISAQQHEHAAALIEAEGLSDRIDLRLSDYRDLDGTYDKAVSIEMIEAVGHEYLETFFAKCSELLRPDGLFALQAITIPDQRYNEYRRSVDFIQRYIFPGGFLPSVGAITRSVGRATDFQMIHSVDFAEHYATTLMKWRERFTENQGDIEGLGMTDSFLRMWEYYLCYCEGAFREKQIGVSHMLFQKPENRRLAQVPSLPQSDHARRSHQTNETEL